MLSLYLKVSMHRFHNAGGEGLFAVPQKTIFWIIGLLDGVALEKVCEYTVLKEN